MAQEDIEITDSVSTEWDGGIGGGGLNPDAPSNPVTSIDISHAAITLEGGQTFRLGANVNATAKNKQIAWTSANRDIAFVESDGSVTGISKGTTTITATSVENSTIRTTCTVTVTTDYVSPISGYILSWGKETAWTMKYQKFNISDYSEPTFDANGRNWKELNYDDNGWAELTGPMGNEEIGNAPYNYLWTGYDNCFCLRKTFILTSFPQQSVYRFKAIHDDDLQVYLNGELVATFSGSSEQEVEVVIPSDKFVKGVNQLALFIQQGSGGAYLDYALYQEPISKFTLTYIVDGKFYKAVEYQYGETITPESTPTKKGYKFSGWSEMPETMPAKDIEITGTFISATEDGDLNNDKYVDISDVVTLVGYILGNNFSINKNAADMNGDGEIDISDVVTLVAKILSKG